MPVHKHDEENGKHTCGFCHKTVTRKQNLERHIKTCPVRIITERFETRDFKSYEVQQDNHRLILMMPYNRERGLKMYISGPPRCGKSHFIGNNLIEYVRHFPKRNIYLFSQVDADRAIDGAIEFISSSTKWNPDHFHRVELNKLLEVDLDINEFRGAINKKTGERYGSLCIFDDIDKIPNKDLQKKIDELKDAILATGRDHEYRGGDIDLIVTNHNSLGIRGHKNYLTKLLMLCYSQRVPLIIILKLYVLSIAD